MTINVPKKLVAIVVPMSNRTELTPEEEISKRHLLYFLRKYDKFLIVSQNLQVDFSGFEVKRFDNKFFGSVEAHNRLLMSPVFYEAFSEYRFILIYHLDSLVFSDQLTKWCERDYDYIAAPWIKHKDSPYFGMKDWENKVGNGGFSLRKIESFLNVMHSDKYFIDPELFWKNLCSSKSSIYKLVNYPKKILKQLKYRNNALWEMKHYRFSAGFNEEHFWANRATHYCPEFNIASLETALSFAFECVPRYCFKKNNQLLPFGCHAWAKYDREFWEPYLLQ